VEPIILTFYSSFRPEDKNWNLLLTFGNLWAYLNLTFMRTIFDENGIAEEIKFETFAQVGLLIFQLYL